MLVEDVEACSFDRWFHDLEDLTFDSRILPIPDDFLSYLMCNGSVVLPVDCDADDGDHGTDDEDQGDDDQQERPSFPEFCGAIRKALAELGGSVLPKLNWSAPRDAAWIGVGNSLRCTNLSEILLLLKSSDFVLHDLTQPFKDCQDAGEADDGSCPSLQRVLVLKKWSDELNPASEYRCFVRSGRLRAISQRDPTCGNLPGSVRREEVLRDINAFHRKLGRRKTPIIYRDYVFDVALMGRGKVILVDLNPFGPTTDPLLFSWPELLGPSLEEGDVCLRTAATTSGDRGILPNGLGQFAMPRDFADLMSGTDPDKLVDFLRLQEHGNDDHGQQQSDDG